MSHTDTRAMVRARIHRLRWTTFALVVLAYILSFFHRTAPATIAEDLRAAFDTSAAALGTLAATYFYVYAATQIPTGILVDTWGPRRILTVGGIIAAAGSALFGLADDFTAAAVGRLLVGLGVSVTFVAMLKLHSAWFHDRHFGTATGLSILLGNIGAVLGAAPLAWALGVVSWRTVFVVVGVLSLVFGVLTWYLVRNRPEDAGLPSMRELDGEIAHPPHEGHWYDGLLRVLGNPWTWPGFFVTIGLSGAYFAFAGLWAVPFLQNTYGMERTLASYHTSAMLLGFALGAFSVGAISDRLGRRKPVLIAASVVNVLSWLPLLATVTMPAAMSLALFFLMGISAAGFTLIWACSKEVNPHALSGMAVSVVNTGAFLGTGILQPLVGWGIDRAAARGATGAALYADGMWILFGFALFGLLATVAVRETYCRYVRR